MCEEILPLDLNCNSGFFTLTRVFSGTDRITKAFPPITTPSPMIVSPPKMLAPEYIVTLSQIVGWRLTPFMLCPPFVDKAPRVTP